MPFLKRACQITRFRLTQPPRREQLQQAVEDLARKGFRPIDTLPDANSVGWVNFEDPTDSEWRTASPDRLAHLVWALRVDQRKVPAKLVEVRTRAEIKKALERKRDEIRQKVLIPFVNKDERKDIRERVYLSLLSQAAPVPTMADVVWINPADWASAEIWLCTTSPSLIEKFQTLFRDTFRTGWPQPVGPFTPQPESAVFPEDIGQKFLTWLYSRDGGAFDVLDMAVVLNFERLTIADAEGDVTIKAVIGESDPLEISRGIEKGMLVTDCEIVLAINAMDFGVKVRGSDFALRLDTKTWTNDFEDAEGTFADKVLSVERFCSAWDALYRLWLQERGYMTGAEVYKPAVGVEQAARNALAQMPGLKTVSKDGGGDLNLHFNNGTTLTVKGGGKNA